MAITSTANYILMLLWSCLLQLLSEILWQPLTVKQKQICILSLYYAANWIRELVNKQFSSVKFGF